MGLSQRQYSELESLESWTFDALDRVGRRLAAPRITADLRPILVSSARAQPAWWDSVAGLLLIAAVSEGASIDERIIEAAAGCELLMIATTLFDAVEDDALDGPIAELEPEQILGAGTVVLELAREALLGLGEGLSAERPAQIRRAIDDRTQVVQHRGPRCVRAESIEQALELARSRTEVFALAAELGALAAGCEPELAELYALLGRHSALLRQCGNDLGDLLGHGQRVDPRTSRWTLPLVACWEESDADGRDELMGLLDALPDSLPRIRRQLYYSGAIRRVALVMERARSEIHWTIAHLGLGDSPMAIVGAHADMTRRRLYSALEVH